MLRDLASPTDLAERALGVMQRICERDESICTAESRTGGLVAALFTDIEGCSHAFERGFVAYTENAKTELLGVDSSLLKEKGAVSKDVGMGMAKGSLQHSDADLALAVTGFAGPSDTAGEEGLVHFALAQQN